MPRGSHNMTVHPSGDYLYNSNSDLVTSTAPAITIYDISQPETPRKVQDYPIPFVPLSLGSESHDITFNADGTRAYSAALSQTLVLDTTDPANPEQVAQILDPAINVAHQADPVADPGGRQRARGPRGHRRARRRGGQRGVSGRRPAPLRHHREKERAPRRSAPGSSPSSSRRTGPPAPPTC